LRPFPRPPVCRYGGDHVRAADDKMPLAPWLYRAMAWLNDPTRTTGMVLASGDCHPRSMSMFVALPSLRSSAPPANAWTQGARPCWRTLMLADSLLKAAQLEPGPARALNGAIYAKLKQIKDQA
jgi:hypothetical protein